MEKKSTAVMAAPLFLSCCHRTTNARWRRSLTISSWQNMKSFSVWDGSLTLSAGTVSSVLKASLGLFLLLFHSLIIYSS
ncbi:hypothetical protein CRG98_039637 [Punica granatum]|uniref:Uncharacterized protein n=1 Tax=Punica granatum TaxID=22663 RepID=A0A2I0I7J5_PUNGR|nr:hypothetical protein CRG98_039637 [Punica granatum]